MTYSENIALGITADSRFVQLVITRLFKFRPVRRFLSIRHRPVALDQVAPEDRNWI